MNRENSVGGGKRNGSIKCGRHYVLINLTIASATRNLINKQVQFCEKLEYSLKKLVKPSDEVNSYLPVEFKSFFFVFF